MALVIAQILWGRRGFRAEGKSRPREDNRKETTDTHWGLGSVAAGRATGDGFHQLMRLSGLGLIVRRVARIGALDASVENL